MNDVIFAVALVSSILMVGRCLYMAFAGGWRWTYICQYCNFHTTWAHDVMPCKSCGRNKNRCVIARPKFFGGYEVHKDMKE